MSNPTNSCYNHLTSNLYGKPLIIICLLILFIVILFSKKLCHWEAYFHGIYQKFLVTVSCVAGQLHFGLWLASGATMTTGGHGTLLLIFFYKLRSFILESNSCNGANPMLFLYRSRHIKYEVCVACWGYCVICGTVQKVFRGALLLRTKKEAQFGKTMGAFGAWFEPIRMHIADYETLKLSGHIPSLVRLLS